MKKLKLSTREIGSVNVFDLDGDPTEETLRDIANQIQKKIRKHRMQRIILNLQGVPEVDALGVRKLLAACIRPQSSLIYGASNDTLQRLSDSYLPHNVRVCDDEAAVAETFGPFLLEKDRNRAVARTVQPNQQESIGHQVERRRSKRMHVAIPVEFLIHVSAEEKFATKAIITNISEGGLFAEYLDLGQAQRIEKLPNVDNLLVDIRIPPCANFPEEYNVQGVITRREFRKKQLGIAIKFIPENAEK